MCYHPSGFPGGSVIKNPPANSGDTALIFESGRFPGEGKAAMPVFLPGKSHGQRSEMGYKPWELKRVAHD